jgi:hypothetical protein
MTAYGAPRSDRTTCCRRTPGRHRGLGPRSGIRTHGHEGGGVGAVRQAVLRHRRLAVDALVTQRAQLHTHAGNVWDGIDYIYCVRFGATYRNNGRQADVWLLTGDDSGNKNLRQRRQPRRLRLESRPEGLASVQLIRDRAVGN